MSNYPAGVTGREPQIAGYDELDEELLVDECVNNGGFNLVIVVGRWMQSLDTKSPSKYARNTNRRVKTLDCHFEGGAVEGVVIDRATFYWECPSCGQENEMDVTSRYEEPEREYEPDHWD